MAQADSLSGEDCSASRCRLRPPDDELALVQQPRIMAKRRRTRRRTITTLPDHVREQLVQAFSQVDVEGTGQVHRLKLVEIVKEAYRPTEQEVRNVELYLTRHDECRSHLFGDREISFEGFVALFNAVVQPMLSSSPCCSLGWTLLREIFDTAVTQLARHGSPETAVAAALGAENIEEIYSQELRSLFEAVAGAGVNRSTTWLCELVRQAFILPPKKLSQLAVFFNTSRDELVELGQFVHGMTLLYGDMQLLSTHSAPPSSPAAAPAPPRLQPIHIEEPIESLQEHREPSSPSLSISRQSSMPRRPSLPSLHLPDSPRIALQSVPPALWASPPPPSVHAI